MEDGAYHGHAREQDPRKPHVIKANHCGSLVCPARASRSGHVDFLFNCGQTNPATQGKFTGIKLYGACLLARAPNKAVIAACHCSHTHELNFLYAKHSNVTRLACCLSRCTRRTRTTADWDRCFQDSVHGAFLVTRQILKRAMIPRKTGVIVR